MTRHLLAIAALLAAAVPCTAQTTAITGGTVYTAAGAPIEGGTVLIRDGHIVAVGADVTVPADAERIDATGQWVTPGLIVFGTQLGLVEISSVADTRDGSYSGSDISAAFNPLEGVNPASQLIPVQRLDGVTTSLLTPSGGLVAGQAVVVDLAGERIEDMLVRSPAGVVVNLGNTDAGGDSRAGVMALLRRLFRDAREFDRRRADYRRDEMQPLAATPADLEVLLSVLRREQPLFVRAARRADLENALRLAEEFTLDLVLVGAEEAWQIAERLAAAQVPVVLDPLTDIPDYDALSPRLDNAALLAAAGVRLVISPFDSHNARNVRQAAGNAVAWGLPWETALRAITAEAARVAGVADRYGTIEPGKVANVVVWTADPLDFAAAPVAVFIRGQRMPLTSRQTELLERYRTLPPRY